MKTLKKLSATILVLVLLFPRPGLCEAAKLDLTAYTPANAAVRSLVFPGWGQWFNSQDVKAYILGGLALAGIAATYSLDQRADSTYSDYVNRGVKNDPLYDDYEAQQQQAATAFYFTAAVWIYGIADAYITADRYNKSQRGSKNINAESGMRFACNSGDISIIYRLRY
ncbi:MAG: DUF5683 domain-containing protein [Elusimicrobiota bacterium]